MIERISKPTLERDLWADMLTQFLHGTKKDWQLAERRYRRFMRTRRRE